MERCAVCGAEEFIPYICRYCGGAHCVYHRLPENHECPNIHQARAPKATVRSEQKPTSSIRLLKISRFSIATRREATSIAIAWLVLALSFSIGFFTLLSTFEATALRMLTEFLLILAIVGIGFIGHELAHKFVARRFGYWAEFRLWTQGAVMAIVFAVVTRLAFATPFVFAAPGAVYVSSRSGYFGSGADSRSSGIISAMGPIVNVLAASSFGAVMMATTGTGMVLNALLRQFLEQGIMVNLWLGAFNMLPIYVLDGQKILFWNRTVWAILTGALWASVFIVLFALR